MKIVNYSIKAPEHKAKNYLSSLKLQLIGILYMSIYMQKKLFSLLKLHPFTYHKPTIVPTLAIMPYFSIRVE